MEDTAVRLTRALWKWIVVLVGCFPTAGYCDSLSYSFASFSESFGANQTSGLATVSFAGLGGTLEFPTLTSTNSFYVFDRVQVGTISVLNETNPATGQPPNLSGFNYFDFDIQLTIQGVTQSTQSTILTVANSGIVDSATLLSLIPPVTFHLPEATVVFNFYTSPSYARDGLVDGAFYLYAAAPIPEPATVGMLLAGLGLLGFAARRRRLKEAAAA